MKKVLLFCLFCTATFSWAQTPIAIVTTPSTNYVYVGSLNRGSDDSANSQKIVVKVFGGSWYYDSNGETTFYIANRGGLNINETSIGGSTAGRMSLSAFQNGGNIDFYIVPKANDYTSFAVTAYSYGYAIPSQYVNVTSQSNLPAGTDITSTVPFHYVMMTDIMGNVGIGTSAPDAKLTVAGPIHSKEVRVDLSIPVPDYVFKRHYKLAPLKDVEEYISKNHHLSDIPSAKTINREGLNLGEMNAMLLKKVEELTLYLIRQDKFLKDQQEADKKQRQINIKQQKQLGLLTQKIEAISK